MNYFCDSKCTHGFEKKGKKIIFFFLEIEITNVVHSWFFKMKNHGVVWPSSWCMMCRWCATLCDPNLFQENAIFFQQNFFPPPQNDRRSRSTHCFTLTNYITTEEKVFVLLKNISHGKKNCSHFSRKVFFKRNNLFYKNFYY